MQQIVTDWLVSLGLQRSWGHAVTVTIGVALMVLLAIVAYFVAKKLILRLVNYLVAKTETRWDDFLVERGVFSRLANIAPALVLYVLVPLVFDGHGTAVNVLQRLVAIYSTVIAVLIVDAVLSAAHDIYGTFHSARQIPLKGFFQVLKVVGFCIGGIVVLAILLDKTPLYLLSGLGALTAVLLIVFKDPILGLVAGIQLSANRMVAIDDWISMPSHGADGDVIEVALTTVKVRNWDKTITTIPTYDLISSSFKNWRGMKESGGRRICRALNIDLNTIRFCDETLLARLEQVQLLRPYLARKREELAAHNRQHQADDASLANGRRLTNIGTFRAYVVAYLRQHPGIREDMTFLVRQLAPSEHGLPIQIYVFTDTTVWAEYEAIQADIFDHVLAVVREFDLRLFQEPTGQDFRGAFDADRPQLRGYP